MHQHKLHLIYILFIPFWFGLLGCTAISPILTPTPATSPTPNCNGAFVPIPTQPFPTDPDPNATALPEEPSNTWPCPTPTPPPTAVPTPYSHINGGAMQNLTLDDRDQHLLAVAVGRNKKAIAWLDDDELILSISSGGRQLERRSLGAGHAIAMAYSQASRLHVAYVGLDNTLYYLIADGDSHPADPQATIPYLATPVDTDAHHPAIAVDEFGYAHIFYEKSAFTIPPSLKHARHIANNQFEFHTIDEQGHGQTAVSNYNGTHPNPHTHWEDGLMIAYRVGDQHIRIARYHSPLGLQRTWEIVHTIQTTEERIIGQPHLTRDETQTLYCASWVGYTASPAAPPPLKEQPRIQPTNSLAPNSISNADYVHDHFNSVQVQSTEAEHTASLYQSLTVGAGNYVEVQANGRCASDTPCQMQIGLDPYGGTNPEGSNVIWSGLQSPTDSFAPFHIATTAQEDTITLFLRSDPDSPANIYWDAISTNAGTVQNGSFEEGFAPYNGNPTLQLPDGWQPALADPSFQPPPEQDHTRAEATCSTNRGDSWDNGFAVAQNMAPSTGRTGAIQAGSVVPLIRRNTPFFVYVYEAGDPPPDSEFIRYGRLHYQRCNLTDLTCEWDGWGELIYGRTDTRPIRQHQIAPDPLTDNWFFVAWSALQIDNQAHDLYSTFLLMAEED